MKYQVIYILIILVTIILLNTIKFERIENFEDKNENENDNEIKNVFFTGGFDSTAILVNAFLNTKYIIQPIYVSDPNLDNNINIKKRKNHIFEKRAMNKIISELKADYPYYSHRLKDLKEINKVEYDEETKKDMMSLYLNKYSFRPVRQYGGLAQVCKDYNFNSELGVLKGDDLCHKLTHKHIGNNKFIPYLEKVSNYGSNDCKLNLGNCEPYFKVYEKFRFPFLHLNKKEIYLKAVKENWNKYLEYTWSCWYPKNGEPCGSCDMCRGRVIPQRKL
jgi:hypothetical protein